jgi:hypothetical protein
MKRITPEDVVDAYIATGMYPIHSTWTTPDGGACGLGVLFLAAGGRCEDAFSPAIFEKLGEVMGVTGDYCLNFSAGFDPDISGLSRNEATLDGFAAYQAAIAHFSKAQKDAAMQVQPAQELELVR